MIRLFWLEVNFYVEYMIKMNGRMSEIGVKYQSNKNKLSCFKCDHDIDLEEGQEIAEFGDI